MSPMELLTVWLLLGKHAYVITETKTIKDSDKLWVMKNKAALIFALLCHICAY